MPLTVRRALWFAGAFGFAALACLASASADASVLDAIRARGHVLCGVGEGPKGYATVTGQGTWSGISVDFCRARAAAADPSATGRPCSSDRYREPSTWPRCKQAAMGIPIALGKDRLIEIRDRLVEILKNGPFIDFEKHVLERLDMMLC